VVTGKLQLDGICKGYSSGVFIQGRLIITCNSTEDDVIYYTPLARDLVISDDEMTELNNIHLD
jgi:hypothetical protein